MGMPNSRQVVAAFVVCALVAGTAGCSGCGDRNDPPTDAGGDTLDARDTSDATDASDTADTTTFDTRFDASDASDTSGVFDAADASDASDASDTADSDGATDASGPSDTSDASDTTDGDGDPDTGPQPPSGLSTPCSNGNGWTLFKFHWTHNSGSSPRIDVWDATCTYSYASGSACNVQGIRNPSFNSSSRQPKAMLVTRSEYMRVRFSVDGLNFTDADVYAQARSYDTTSSAKFVVSSPLYGSKTSPLVDNDFTYDWYHVPWTGYLKPSDDPDLTAIEISANSGTVAVHAVEVCVH